MSLEVDEVKKGWYNAKNETPLAPLGTPGEHSPVILFEIFSNISKDYVLPLIYSEFIVNVQRRKGAKLLTVPLGNVPRR